MRINQQIRKRPGRKTRPESLGKLSRRERLDDHRSNKKGHSKRPDPQGPETKGSIMHRKMTGLFAALVAIGTLALVPAISSAHGLLDTSEGVTKTVEVGKKLVAYNESGTAVKFVAGGGLTFECGEMTLTGAVSANPHTIGGAVQWTVEDAFIRGSEAETKCKSTMGATQITIPALTSGGGTSHWCIKSTPETDKFTFEPHNCGGAGGEFTFLFHAGGVTCGYTRAANLTGTFNTTNATHAAATLTLSSGQTLAKHIGSVLCPASTELAEFKLELFTDTSAATPGTWRDATNVADPVWIT
ncbi:MAG: hypothetical protein ACJ76B_11065 [Solirubrobacterales bacterium]